LTFFSFWGYGSQVKSAGERVKESLKSAAGRMAAVWISREKAVCAAGTETFSYRSERRWRMQLIKRRDESFIALLTILPAFAVPFALQKINGVIISTPVPKENQSYLVFTESPSILKGEEIQDKR
jgi:hypothetical protein